MSVLKRLVAASKRPIEHHGYCPCGARPVLRDYVPTCDACGTAHPDDLKTLEWRRVK